MKTTATDAARNWGNSCRASLVAALAGEALGHDLVAGLGGTVAICFDNSEGNDRGTPSSPHLIHQPVEQARLDCDLGETIAGPEMNA